MAGGIEFANDVFTADRRTYAQGSDFGRQVGGRGSRRDGPFVNGPYRTLAGTPGARARFTNAAHAATS